MQVCDPLCMLGMQEAVPKLSTRVFPVSYDKGLGNFDYIFLPPSTSPLWATSNPTNMSLEGVNIDRLTTLTTKQKLHINVADLLQKTKNLTGSEYCRGNDYILQLEDEQGSR